MGDEEDLVMCSPDAVEGESKKKRHSDSSQLAVPEVVFLPIREEMCKSATYTLSAFRWAYNTDY